MEDIYQKIVSVIPPFTGFTKEEALHCQAPGPLVAGDGYLLMSAPDTNVIITKGDDGYHLTGHDGIAGPDGKTVGEDEFLEIIGWNGTLPVAALNAAAEFYIERRVSIKTGWLSQP